MKPILFIVFATLLFSCKKADQDCPKDLPCATEVGANTFGCYINGKPWVAEYQEGIVPFYPAAEGHYDVSNFNADYGNRLKIVAKKISDTLEGFLLFEFTPVLGIGTLTNDGAGTIHANLFSKVKQADKIVDVVFFNMERILDYQVDISRFDTDQHIISGTFSMVGIGSRDSVIVSYPDSGLSTTYFSISETIRITEGRFDMKYNPE